MKTPTPRARFLMTRHRLVVPGLRNRKTVRHLELTYPIRLLLRWSVGTTFGTALACGTASWCLAPDRVSRGRPEPCKDIRSRPFRARVVTEIGGLVNEWLRESSAPKSTHLRPILQ